MHAQLHHHRVCTAIMHAPTTPCMYAASYYTSFASVGIVIYLIRVRKGYRSLPEAINERYGSMATLSFGLAVLFRLYQEVWSNALVVAGFYGVEVCSQQCIPYTAVRAS